MVVPKSRNGAKRIYGPDVIVLNRKAAEDAKNLQNN